MGKKPVVPSSNDAPSSTNWFVQHCSEQLPSQAVVQFKRVDSLHAHALLRQASPSGLHCPMPLNDFLIAEGPETREAMDSDVVIEAPIVSPFFM
jgi:hypothetical protein